MVDPITIAIAATAAALPYLEALGKGAAGSAGKSIWDWIKNKLVSPAGHEVIRDLEASPHDGACQKAVEAALSKLLLADPTALDDLSLLLKSNGVSVSQAANVAGDGNVVTQIAGNSNEVSTGQGKR
jgi:hypothetical protein